MRKSKQKHQQVHRHCGGALSYGELIDKIKNKSIRHLSESELDDLIANSDLSIVDNMGFTALMLACRQSMTQLASKLIATGKSMPQYVSAQSFRYKYTALLLACERNLTDVAIQLIETGQSNPGIAGGEDEHTALMESCVKRMNDVAIRLIQTGESNPSYTTLIKRENALLLACKHNLSDVASMLISLDPTFARCINHDSITPLIYACKYNMSEVAIQLIETGQSNPSVAQGNPPLWSGTTALMHACINSMTEVAVKLIDTGQSNPSAVTSSSHMTALMYACNNANRIVANKLISTGESLPAQVSGRKYTALILACKNKMVQTAILLIETGDCNPDYADEYGYTALDYAERNGLHHVEQLLETLLLQSGDEEWEQYVPDSETDNNNESKNDDDDDESHENANANTNAESNNELERETFNIEQTCYDLTMIEDVPITEYLKEAGNIVFVVYDQRVESSAKTGLSVEQLNRSIRDPYCIIYECIEADHIRPENIKRDTKYFDIKKLCGFGDLVYLKDIRQLKQRIQQNEATQTPNVFLFKKTNKHLVSTISDAVLNRNESGISGRHCQAGQDAYVYELQPNPILVSTPTPTPATGGRGWKRKHKHKRTHKKRNCKTNKRNRQHKQNKQKQTKHHKSCFNKKLTNKKRK